MTRTEELMKLCDGSTIFAAVLQEELKQLVELCRLQHVALIELSPCMHKECQQVQKETQDHAIAAFNKFEGGE